MSQLFLSCSMCLGGAEGEIALAANAAIGLMMVFLILVLGSFFSFILFLRKKAMLAHQYEDIPGKLD